jgi:hypothetical protein
MTKIDEYKKAKRVKRDAEKWISLIGREYRGGGGGIGGLRSVSVKAEIYHQEYNGATNYHSIPADLAPYIDRVVLRMFPAIFIEALAAVDASITDLAKQSLAEYKEQLEAEGLIDASN